MKRVIIYARVSIKEQNVDVQLADLRGVWESKEIKLLSKSPLIMHPVLDLID